MQTTPTVPPMTPLRPPVHMPPVPDTEQQRRMQAIKRIRDKNALMIHLAVYLVVNAAFVMTWATRGFGYFWPIFAIVGWGAGIAVHGYCIYHGNDKSAFMLHLAAYLVINAWFVVMWALTEPGYFFWPIIAILLWGAGVVIHGYRVYGGNDTMTETRIEREMK